MTYRRLAWALGTALVVAVYRSLLVPIHRCRRANR